VRVEFEVSFKDAEILKRARELMSQKESKNAQIGETYVTALRDWVDREDPVRKAERARERKRQKAVRVEKPKTHRSSIPADILHQVHLRDRGGCRKRMPDGSNCGCKQWTEIHHIVPKVYGGADTLENLITLCSSHHRQVHERSAC
jgi:5-methylcytosine-specific restriction endonuclease McrA